MVEFIHRGRAVPALVSLLVALTGCAGGGASPAGSAGGAAAAAAPAAAVVTQISTQASALATQAVTVIPVVSGTPAQTTLVVGQPFVFRPTAAAAAGDKLAFMLLNAPAFLSVNATTGEVSGTPAAIDVGTYANVRVAATDGRQTVSGPAFTLNVTNPAQVGSAPVVTGTLSISGAPITVAVEGVAWSFRPVVTLASARSTPRFRVANAPSWTTFDAATGTLSGTPPAGSLGTYAKIVIGVGDGVSEIAMPAFGLAVVAPKPPSIAGKPSSVATVGVAYSFRPTATDQTGRALAYTISGKPGWARFDPATGTLSGVPAVADAGSKATITISVSDGFASAALPAFTVTVGTATAGTATLSWAPPTQRVDGTPLTNLAGFRIYYSTASGKYPNSVSVTSPQMASYTMNNLAAGTYYFVMTAFDSDGNESSYSNPVSKQIG